MLNQKLKKQVTLAAWELGLAIGIIIGYIILFSTVFSSIDNSHLSGGGVTGAIIGGATVFFCAIARFVLWILGIINASYIQKETGDSVILIVFSVLTFIFGHLIVAVQQRNKFGDKNWSSEIKEESKKSYELDLKQKFINGEINSMEYEKKLKSHEKK